ncbi:hypothetical protein T01_1343 [Trichinella spiralis]|uniref:Uncharacterized protein n=1 Tax=Trichinella spiralis TaxID=6334 RepID=A0A0V1BFW8_TRISP|nr:hypothetical protein T01_1343 [Trichinella spiralis]
MDLDENVSETDDNYESINCCLNFKNCPSQKQKGDDRPAKIKTWPCQREPLVKPSLAQLYHFPRFTTIVAELENSSDVVRCADVVKTVIRISCAATADGQNLNCHLIELGFENQQANNMQTSKGCRQGRLCTSNFGDGKMQLQKLEIPLLSDSIWKVKQLEEEYMKYVNEVHFVHFEFLLYGKSVPLNQLMTNFHSIDSAISNKRVRNFVKPHSFSNDNA